MTRSRAASRAEPDGLYLPRIWAEAIGAVLLLAVGGAFAVLWTNPVDVARLEERVESVQEDVREIKATLGEVRRRLMGPPEAPHP